MRRGEGRPNEYEAQLRAKWRPGWGASPREGGVCEASPCVAAPPRESRACGTTPRHVTRQGLAPRHPPHGTRLRRVGGGRKRRRQNYPSPQHGAAMRSGEGRPSANEAALRSRGGRGGVSPQARAVCVAAPPCESRACGYPTRHVARCARAAPPSPRHAAAPRWGEGEHALPVPGLRIIFLFPVDNIPLRIIIHVVPPHREGRLAIVTVCGAGCGDAAASRRGAMPAGRPPQRAVTRRSPARTNHAVRHPAGALRGRCRGRASRAGPSRVVP